MGEEGGDGGGDLLEWFYDCYLLWTTGVHVYGCIFMHPASPGSHPSTSPAADFLKRVLPEKGTVAAYPLLQTDQGLALSLVIGWFPQLTHPHTHTHIHTPDTGSDRGWCVTRHITPEPGMLLPLKQDSAPSARHSHADDNCHRHSSSAVCGRLAEGVSE